MKKCAACKETKEESEFYTYKRRDRVTLYARCKVCHNLRIKEVVTPEQRATHRTKHRAKVRAWVDEQKSGPCTDCGVEYPPYVMDFDHVRGEKYKNISRMVGRYTIAELAMEITKCELVCSNCHRMRTHSRMV